jgi:hypothetical protein
VLRSVRQRRVRAGRRSASARRSPLRSDCPAMLVPAARRTTHFAHCVRCVQTGAPSQSTKRAARAATSPALLGASQARCDGPPAPAFAETPVFCRRTPDAGSARQAVSAGGDLWGDESVGRGSKSACADLDGRSGLALWVSPRRLGVGERSSLRGLTRRTCPNAANEVSAVSCATRPRAEHRSAVGAQRRPPHHEPPADTACRAPQASAREREQRTTGTGRKQPPTLSAAKPDALTLEGVPLRRRAARPAR